MGAGAALGPGLGAGMMAGAGHHELDRGIGGWHVEWLAVPMLFQTAAAATEAFAACLETLQVDGERMASRVDEDGRRALERMDPRLIDEVLARCDQVLGAE